MRTFASTSSKLRQVLDMVDPSIADVIRGTVLVRQSSRTSMAKLAIRLATLMQRALPDQPSSVELGRIADWAAAIGNDWTEHAESLESLKGASDEWHAQLLANADEDAQYAVEDETAIEFPDGWRIVRLDPRNAKTEGSIMGHCIGGYEDSIRRGRYEAYSLRDPNNRPHVTFGFNIKSEYKQYRANLDSLDQIQGKSDQPPIDRYRPYLRRFFSPNPKWEPPLSIIDENGEWKENANLSDEDYARLRLMPVKDVLALAEGDHRVLEEVAATDMRPYVEKVMGEERNPRKWQQNAIIGKLSHMIMLGLATPEEEEYFKRQMADPLSANSLLPYLTWDAYADDTTVYLDDKVPEVKDAIIRLMEWIEQDKMMERPDHPYSFQSDEWYRWLNKSRTAKILNKVPRRVMQQTPIRQILLDKARGGENVEDLLVDKYGVSIHPWPGMEKDLFGPSFRPLPPERLGRILSYLHQLDKDRAMRLLSTMDESLLQQIRPHLTIYGYHYTEGPGHTKSMFDYSEAPYSHQERERRRQTEPREVEDLIEERLRDPYEGQTPFPEMTTASRVMRLAMLAEDQGLPEISDRLEGLI